MFGEVVMIKFKRVFSVFLILLLVACNFYYVNNVDVKAEGIGILLAEEDFDFTGATIGDAVSNYGSSSDGVGWNGNKYGQGLNADTDETYLMTDNPLKYSNI